MTCDFRRTGLWRMGVFDRPTSPLGLAGIQFLTRVALWARVSGRFLACVTRVAFGARLFLLGLLNDRVFGVDGIGRVLVAVFGVVAGLGVAWARMVGGTRMRVRRVAA